MNNANGDASRGASSCESIAALIESLAPAEATATADSIQMQYREKDKQKDLAGVDEPTNREARSNELHPGATEQGNEVLSSMAAGGPKGGISTRMQQAYASSLQRARGDQREEYLHGTNGSANATASSYAGPARGDANSSRVSTKSQALQRSSKGNRGASSGSGCSKQAAREKLPEIENRASERLPGVSAETTEDRAFVTSKEHGMMLDIDYDQANRDWNSAKNATSGPPPAPEGMVYNPLTGVNEYSYAVTTTGGQPYGNMALGAIQQIAPVGPVPVNQGRLADARLQGAYRFNATTGEREYVDGGGMDRVRQFGATDFIDSGASARPNVKADGLPEGFDMNYARQKYEAGVPAGRDPVMRGGERAAEAMQLDAEAKLLDLDPYAALLEPPKVPAKEYATFDGGVDLVKMGLAAGAQARKVIKKTDETEPSAPQEAGDASAEVADVSMGHSLHARITASLAGYL
ncbi:LOW QUALITY PROTEIN: uncharacterized protein EMH_0006870 [Eimeria mitis]|uniref:Uncharacterized protein n=1 Tax=Eimeria mitis TaxID=44415 RepID=U6JYT2_9EIME|nr:LOW QUALITY PROTEIN: uncharacterized protein EMH_0006870 [Eimeria mitis]CDJ30589.1 hypothetical protein, conserved [Eimeria mitis]